MNKAITICLFFVIAITLTSLTKNHEQLDEFPPIQKFLDKIKQQELEGEDPMKISQKLEGNTFTYITDWYDIVSKDFYENIDWNQFSRVREETMTDNIIKCEFYFYRNMQLSSYNNSNEKTLDEKNKLFHLLYSRERLGGIYKSD